MNYRGLIGTVIGLAAIGVLIVVIVSHLTTPSSATPSPSTTPPPATTPVATVTPSPLADRPTDDQVWRLEEANLLPDPTARKQALKDIATPDYIANPPYVAPQPSAAAGISFVVDRSLSSLDPHPGSSPSSYYVIAYPVCTTMRDGVTVNTLTMPAHATEWVKTPEGWRAQQDAPIEMK